MLLCDGCNLGMHTYCLDPPLTDIPDGQWFCEGCADAIAAARKACPPSRKRPLLGSPVVFDGIPGTVDCHIASVRRRFPSPRLGCAG